MQSAGKQDPPAAVQLSHKIMRIMQLQESQTPRNEEMRYSYSKNNIHKKSTRRVNKKQEKSRMEKKKGKKNNNDDQLTPMRPIV